MTASHQRTEAMATPVEFLKGVGPRRGEVLAAHGIHTLHDLLDTLPRRYLDRTTMRRIGDVDVDAETTVMGEVLSVQLVRFGRRRLVVKIGDGTGMLDGVWFAQADFFSRLFKVGQTVAFSGKVSHFRTWQMVHPDFDVIDEEKAQLNTGQLIAVYPSSADLKKVGLNNYALRRIVAKALDKFETQIPETLPETLVRRYHLCERSRAYRYLHFPESAAELDQAYRRFKYEELFYLELLVALRRHFTWAPLQGLQVTMDVPRMRQAVEALPFELTGAQKRVLSEIRADMESGAVMNRLVQGDVGSGKTVVALLAMRLAIDSGYQTALMAPTEILAQQHFFNISDLVEDETVRIGLLTGSMKAAEKRKMQERIAAGEIDLVVGTHAVIQEAVRFKNLGMVVIDEQHRFGVMQRAGLIEKGRSPHTLVMTATPIPRTLALTIYGDLDVSVIDEKPPGRREIRTYWRREERLDAIHAFLRERLEQGEQVYVVYPLVEESEKMDLKAATAMYDHLRAEVFPDRRVALLHGRMKMAEKEAVMQAFKNGEADILVATTVIEVGVDVPNATIMVIEHAERFGLSQLHQLRGRVGRGNAQSWCILVTPPETTEQAVERMKVMEETNDGFVIAEADLRLRGSGEFFGTRQHGMPDLRYADLIVDHNIVTTARADAFALVDSDPHLRRPDHAGVRRQFTSRYAEKYNLPNIA